MSFLASLKINKSINILIEDQFSSQAEVQEAFNRIKNKGPSVVPRLIDAYMEAPKNSHIDYLLLHFLDNKTLPDYVDGLAYEDRRVVAGVTRVLMKSRKYDPNRLYELFEDPAIPKGPLVQILIAQKDSLHAKSLLELIEKVSRENRQLVLRVLDQIVTEDMVPALVKYTQSDDPTLRLHVTRAIGRFSTPQVREALIRVLSDKNKAIRQAALIGLGNMKIPVASRQIVPLLKDSDLTVQARAIETLIKIHDPDVVKYLIDILQDESEYIRRAAVEVLNEVGDASAIKDLLNAMRDKDWWVKVRAADALGTIGGPKVVDAIVEIINDKDEFLRRTAVEILNTLKDERAVSHLIKALADEDWWVRERAADALANMGCTDAVPALIKMMQKQPKSVIVAIKALAQLQDPAAIDPLLKLLKSDDEDIKKEAIQALKRVTNEQNSARVKKALNESIASANKEIAELANDTVQTVMAKVGNDQSQPSTGQNISPETGDTDQKTTAVSAGSANQYIDAATLKPGQIVDERYKIIREVGKGAFGVVLLVEDMMVHEEIILKFLNAHMASDESVIKRFVSELRLTRKITHKNVIRIYDFITIGKSYAISMEFFESKSLSQEIRAGRAKNFERNVRLLIDICSGLSVAHKINVVHRDIKPANILVNDTDLVKIVDFGLAAAASQGDARLTKSGILVGTPTYMAPEQVRGRKIDTRTDIYSLGIVMYEMFTGRPPFKEKDHMATLFKHVEGKPIMAQEKNPAVSDELNRIIMRAIHVDAEKRYQTVDELQHDLEELHKQEFS